MSKCLSESYLSELFSEELESYILRGGRRALHRLKALLEERISISVYPELIDELPDWVFRYGFNLGRSAMLWLLRYIWAAPPGVDQTDRDDIARFGADNLYPEN